MYTQCPDCRAAFRVTAHVLQQAAGNVRCGGCGHAFNALEQLTEELPDSNGSSVRQKKALLDSLDEITGPHNVRIEDTGVEWRVLDEDLEPDEPDHAVTGRAENAGDAEDAGDAFEAAESGDTSSVRWFIEDSPDGPEGRENGDAANDEAAPAAADVTAQASLNLPAAGPDEERYDDNTPFPGALDDNGEESPGLPEPRRRAEDRLEPRSPEFDERQVDLALSEPEEWTDLLDEVGVADEPTPDRELPLHERLSLEGEPSASKSDGTEADSIDFPSDVDTHVDLEVLEVTGGESDPTGDQPVIGAGELTLLADDEPIDPDELTLLADEEPIDPDELTLLADEEPIDPDELTLLADEEPIDVGHADDALTDGSPESDIDGDDHSGFADAVVVDDDREPTGEFERRIALAAAALTGNESDSDTGAPGAEAPPPDAASSAHYVPPPTEEEMTINMLIDQDLLRLAEEEDVFTATAAGAARDPQHEPPHVETIIMEGEFVRNSLEANLPPAAWIEIEAPIDAPPSSLKDTWIRTRDRLRGGRRRRDPPSYALMAGVAALALLLTGQVVHAYRESLATFSAFDRTVGSLYRLFGASITPDWNVNGWQFEATSGSTDELDQVLTISSRIANRSDKPLPYPLLHVSLTDRYEEIVGSRVLEPGQYLADATRSGNVAPGGTFTATVTIAALSPEATGFKLNVCYRLTEEQVRCATGAFRD